MSVASKCRATAIETMIRLSLTSNNVELRRQSSLWLAENCNVNVTQEKGGSRATTAPANDLR